MSFAFFKKAQAILQEVEQHENENIQKAVDLLVNTIQQGNSIFSFGVAHAGMLTEELFYRAGGLAVINPIFARELTADHPIILQTSMMERLEGYGNIIIQNQPIKEHDVLILHSVSGRNCVPIDMALEAKKRGAHIICITSLKTSQSVTSRHSSGKKLYEVSDIVIDNHGEMGDACIEIEGIDQKVGSSSTVVGASIVNEIVVRVVDTLVKSSDDLPPIFFSANVDGGDEKNRRVMDQYKSAIHYRT